MILKYIKAPLISPLSPIKTINPNNLMTMSSCIAHKTKIIRKVFLATFSVLAIKYARGYPIIRVINEDNAASVTDVTAALK